MSRYLSVEELPAVAARNGLRVDVEPYTRALLIRRKSGSGGYCGVLYGPQGLIDWHATAMLVLKLLYGREVSRG